VITLAIVNARVQTGNPRQPWASGIAVDGERIVAVGSSAEVAKLVVSSTRVVDALGMLVRNQGGKVERGGRSDFIVVNDSTLNPAIDLLEPDVRLRVSGGEILLDRTAE